MLHKNNFKNTPFLDVGYNNKVTENTLVWMLKVEKKNPLHTDFMLCLDRTNNDGSDPETQPSCRLL